VSSPGGSGRTNRQRPTQCRRTSGRLSAAAAAATVTCGMTLASPATRRSRAICSSPRTPSGLTAAGRVQALHGYREVIDYWAAAGNWTHQRLTPCATSHLLRALGDLEPAALLDAGAGRAPDAPPASGCTTRNAREAPGRGVRWRSPGRRPRAAPRLASLHESASSPPPAAAARRSTVEWHAQAARVHCRSGDDSGTT
jgi:hypothetical protein